jgi:hypothetical protein
MMYIEPMPGLLDEDFVAAEEEKLIEEEEVE